MRWIGWCLVGVLAAEERLTVHGEPKALAEEAVTAAWPRFLGPEDDATTPEGPLLKEWPDEGPEPLWELELGESYAAPAVADGRLFVFHRLDGEERVECRDPESGRERWSFAEKVEYRDRYGFAAGPRAAPVIAGERVVVAGVTGVLRVLSVEDGRVLWRRDLVEDFGVPQYFFGYGPSPLVLGERVIVHVGGEPGTGEGVCVAAFDLASGELAWACRDEWGASYASPVAATIRGREVVLVMGGGESRPPHGGLLVIDAKDGTKLARVPWRADKYESVIAMSPLPLGDDAVFVSECYEKGGAVVEFDDDFAASFRWRQSAFGMHWMMPLERDGVLYGFAGRNPPDTSLKGVDLGSGEVLWEDEVRWREGRWVHGMFRGSLLEAGERVFALGEDGAFAELKLGREGVEILRKTRLFTAREAWTLPVLSRGLLYVNQNSADMETGKGARLVCYDLRGR